MADCDGFFEEAGIPFLPQYADAAVRAVRAADFHDAPYKKWLIICWFDTTFGTWTGPRFDANNSRVMMAGYLATTPYTTYEELLLDPLEAQ